MDAELRELIRQIRQIDPTIADWLERMWQGGYSPSELRTIARALLDSARAYGVAFLSQVAAALARIARLRGMVFPALDSLFTAGTGAGGGAVSTGAGGAAATGAGSAGGAAAAGASTAAILAALLLLLLALGFLSYRVYNELTAELDLGDSGGTPCGVGKAGETMAFSPREIVTSSAWGRKASMQAAIDEAYADAARLAGNCTGSCGRGKRCQPSVAVMEIEQWSRFPWFRTYTRILYSCPCLCL